MPQKLPTLIEYYKNFKEVSGIMASAFTVVPLVSALLPATPSAYSFPPIGDASMPARLGAFILAALVTFVCFFDQTPAKPARKLTLITVASLLSLFCYALCFNHFVRKIEIPANDSEIFLSIGYERTTFAAQTFGSEDDWDILRARGTREEEVTKLWTARSLDIARLALFASYCGFLLPIVAAFSLGVRYQL